MTMFRQLVKVSALQSRDPQEFQGSVLGDGRGEGSLCIFSPIKLTSGQRLRVNFQSGRTDEGVVQSVVPVGSGVVMTLVRYQYCVVLSLDGESGHRAEFQGESKNT
jgi:hypothetical protein